ncbi:hypothetical protein, partial [Pseudomonas viridiflava]|uniref:hypothetical protein n=2 Tax=Pseudomonas viridiflava TaxID=33069 RepID=UPI00198262F3
MPTALPAPYSVLATTIITVSSGTAHRDRRSLLTKTRNSRTCVRGSTILYKSSTKRKKPIAIDIKY